MFGHLWQRPKSLGPNMVSTESKIIYEVVFYLLNTENIKSNTLTTDLIIAGTIIRTKLGEDAKYYGRQWPGFPPVHENRLYPLNNDEVWANVIKKLDENPTILELLEIELMSPHRKDYRGEIKDSLRNHIKVLGFFALIDQSLPFDFMVPDCVIDCMNIISKSQQSDFKLDKETIRKRIASYQPLIEQSQKKNHRFCALI